MKKENCKERKRRANILIASVRDDKLFIGYGGFNIQYLNRNYSKLTPNVGGGSVKTEAWNDKFEVLCAEVSGLNDLHKHIAIAIPLSIISIASRMTLTWFKQTGQNEHTKETLVNKVNKFYYKLVCTCATKSLDLYFYTLQRYLSRDKRNTVKTFLKFVPPESFFNIVFAKFVSLAFRRQILQPNAILSKMLPPPVCRGDINPMNMYGIQMNSISHKLSTYILDSFDKENKRKIGVDFSSVTRCELDELTKKIVSDDIDTVNSVILLNTVKVPLTVLFMALDKISIFASVKEGGR